jgi:predicted metal-binding protein
MEQGLKSYSPPWKGRLLLACRKCQKKLKKSEHQHALANLKKTVKARSKQHPENGLHVLSVPCMDMCPKNAVAVCMPSKAADRLFLLRSKADLDQLSA